MRPHRPVDRNRRGLGFGPAVAIAIFFRPVHELTPCLIRCFNWPKNRPLGLPRDIRGAQAHIPCDGVAGAEIGPVFVRAVNSRLDAWTNRRGVAVEGHAIE